MEKASGFRKKIFILLSRVPWPLEKGDKLRAYHQLRELSKNHEIILCALSEGDVPPQALESLRPFAREIHFLPLKKSGIIFRLAFNCFSSLPFQVAYFYNKNLKNRLQQLLDHYQPDHIYCQLIRTAQYLKDVAADKVIDYQDVFSLGLKRRKELASWYMKPLLQLEYRRVVQYEARVFEWFNRKTIISSPDRDAIMHPEKHKIVIIPNGVDLEYYKPQKVEKQYDLIFSGNMAYPPNIHAAEYLVGRIMPLIWRQRPQTSLVVAGATPAARVRQLASARVRITGWVDDMRQYYDSSRVFIAPMQIGTGLQNKVLEAMAMQLPCIASELANQALEANPGTQILLGNNPEDYAQQVLSLLNDPQKHNALALNGYHFVHHHFNWEKVCEKLEKLIVQDVESELTYAE